MLNALRALRVLIVEDNDSQRRILAASLDAIGIGLVDQAADGDAALGLLERFPTGYDLTISGLCMEGMDGIEFMRRAAQLPLGSLLLVSAVASDLMASAEQITQTYGIPCAGRLPQPFQALALRELIEQFVLHPERALRRSRGALRPPRTWLRSELECALARGEFLPYFQPKVDLRSGRVHSVEMLARWQHPRLGVLAPLDFIDQMELEGMGQALTADLLDQALVCLSYWAGFGVRPGLAINCSPTALQDVDSAPRLLEQVRRHGVAPEAVTIELTETVMAQENDGLLETLLRLRLHGFAVSLDDFGVGFSSLQQLSRSPFSELKIDRCFVTGAHRDPRRLAILESIAALSRSLGLCTVAEGIETEEDLELVRALLDHRSLGQGYLFSKPLDCQCYLAWHQDFEAAANHGPPAQLALAGPS